MIRLSRRRAYDVQHRSSRPDAVRVSSPLMEFRLLRYFVAVAEERHFGRAAARLHMTQPPLSRAIQQLENDLGVVLLLRSPTGVALTAAGKALYTEATTLLEQAERARARVTGRPWFQLPDGTDPVWRDYWNGATPVGERPAGPAGRTVNECLQAVLWNGAVGIAPLTHALPDGLTWAPLTDMPPSPLVVAWATARESPLIHSFTQIAVDTYRSART